MAVLYFGVNVGGKNPVDVATSSSTTSRDIELAISDANLAAGLAGKKGAVQTALEAIEQAIQEYDF